MLLEYQSLSLFSGTAGEGLAARNLWGLIHKAQSSGLWPPQRQGCVALPQLGSECRAAVPLCPGLLHLAPTAGKERFLPLFWVPGRPRNRLMSAGPACPLMGRMWAGALGTDELGRRALGRHSQS